MKLLDIEDIEKATKRGRRESFRLGVALIFIVGVMLYAGVAVATSGTGAVLLVAAAMIGGYMAMNIGANDVANNVGPAVGAKAITMTGALIIAAICEVAGALIAGGDVVSTIQGGIIKPDAIADAQTFIWIMLAALLAGALWLNIATAFGAPVSTTHSIVGAVLGSGLAAGGLSAANWGVLGNIALSWVISPLMGGLIAAAFLYFIKHTITYREDMSAAARRVVPWLVGLMAFAFGTYLVLKGLCRVWSIGFPLACAIGAACGLLAYCLVRWRINQDSLPVGNDKSSINALFTVPLIGAAALLSFAHGANDVANAVGPLAAITATVKGAVLDGNAPIPIWVMLVGGLGIALGLGLYGPKLIRTVGNEITELDQMRAFCIAMAAAVTVILASQLGLPVSSTHIAVGGVFGVGFLREFLKTNYSRMLEDIRLHHAGTDKEEVDDFLRDFEQAPATTKRLMLKQLKNKRLPHPDLSKQERSDLKRAYKHELVKRSALNRIITAWVVTVPISGGIAALCFFVVRGMMLP
ncbi:MAG: Sulfate permease CysP [Betaproteobacteria bacterium ADurb.Bin341]|nr:MAG: Sulfate permease CysP [Betaproteobacteria bacterium ADurb.Bin341]